MARPRSAHHRCLTQQQRWRPLERRLTAQREAVEDWTGKSCSGAACRDSISRRRRQPPRCDPSRLSSHIPPQILSIQSCSGLSGYTWKRTTSLVRVEAYNVHPLTANLHGQSGFSRESGGRLDNPHHAIVPNKDGRPRSVDLAIAAKIYES